MAHWAKINEDSLVEDIIVTSNDEADEGESWIAENLEGTWVKTSYSTRRNRHLLGAEPFRKNFAEIGGTYSVELDAFIPAKREGESNFVLDETTCIWVPPIPFPTDADFVLAYGNEPELIEQEVEIDGQVVTRLVPNIPAGSRIYYWIPESNEWGMQPNSDKPSGNFNWDPIEKQWIDLGESANYPSDTQEWPSWIQGEDGLWKAPVEMPADGKYAWDEVAGNWHSVSQYEQQYVDIRSYRAFKDLQHLRVLV